MRKIRDFIFHIDHGVKYVYRRSVQIRPTIAIKIKEIEKIEKDIDEEEGRRKKNVKNTTDITSRIDRGVKYVFKQSAKIHPTIVTRIKEPAP